MIVDERVPGEHQDLATAQRDSLQPCEPLQAGQTGEANRHYGSRTLDEMERSSNRSERSLTNEDGAREKSLLAQTRDNVDEAAVNLEVSGLGKQTIQSQHDDTELPLSDAFLQSISFL